MPTCFALLLLWAPGAVEVGAGQIFVPVETEGPVGVFIAAGEPARGYRDGDRELARWAFEAWADVSQGALRFREVAEELARIRLYWSVPPGTGYGTTSPLVTGERIVAAVGVNPSPGSLRPELEERARRDPLFRDAVIYLTCLHEIGHALALGHTSDPADVMYGFGEEEDVMAYFGRYRDRLATRGEIRRERGLSAGDRAALRRLYPRRSGGPTGRDGAPEMGDGGARPPSRRAVRLHPGKT